MPFVRVNHLFTYIYTSPKCIAFDHNDREFASGMITLTGRHGGWQKWAEKVVVAAAEEDDGDDAD